MKPFPILDLPRELRDGIVKQVMLISPDPFARDIPRSTRSDVKYAAWFGGQGVLYPSDVPEPVPQRELAALSRANRQLHSEIRNLLDSLPASVKRSYSLDIELLEETRLLPSWTRVPVLTNRVEELHASIHILPTEKVKLRPRSGFKGGDGGPPRISWSFLSILERVLIAGPVYRELDPDSPDRLISIRKLIIDVITPVNAMPEIEEETDTKQSFRGIPHVQSNADDRMHFLSPSYLCNFLKGMLRILLAYHSTYGAILYERLGVIELSLDGKLQSAWNLSAMIRDRIPPEDDWWRGEVCRTRERLGLETGNLEQNQTPL